MSGEQVFYQRKAETAAQTRNKMDTQASRPGVKCGSSSLENVFHFKYLDSIFAADGSHDYDVTRRIKLAMTRCGKLRNVFSSPDIPLPTKLSIYKTAVMSVLTYGCEAWALTDALQARLNGANSSQAHWPLRPRRSQPSHPDV